MYGFDETAHTSKAGLHYNMAGSGPAIVMLHGSGPGVTGWSNFSENFPVLAEQFTVVIPDMPGFGRSPLPDLDRVYPEVAAEAIIGLMDELGIDNAHLVGNSMGGYVATMMALEHPDRVNRMALMGPGGLAVNLYSPQPSEGAKALHGFFANPSNEAMAAWVDTMVGNVDVVNPQMIQERTERALQPGVIETTVKIFGSLREHAGKHTPPWARAASLTTPTLLIWGRDDRMLPYEQSVFAFRQLPNAELHVFSNCGHWAQIERKDEFERLVTEYFTR